MLRLLPQSDFDDADTNKAKRRLADGREVNWAAMTPEDIKAELGVPGASPRTQGARRTSGRPSDRHFQHDNMEDDGMSLSSHSSSSELPRAREPRRQPLPPRVLC